MIMMNTNIVVSILLCSVHVGTSSVDTTKDLKCDLKAWYMEALTEGLLDDETDDDSKSDVMAEVLQLVRRKKGFLYVDCAQIDAYDRILRAPTAHSGESTRSDLDIRNDSTDIDTEYDSDTEFDARSTKSIDEEKTISDRQGTSESDTNEIEKPSDELRHNQENVEESKPKHSERVTFKSSNDGLHRDNLQGVTDENKEIKEDTGKDVLGASESVEENAGKNVAAASEKVIEDADKDVTGASDKLKETTSKDVLGANEKIKEGTGKDVLSANEKIKEGTGKDVLGANEKIKEGTGKDVLSANEKIKEDTSKDVLDKLQDVEEDRNSTSPVPSTDSEKDVAGNKYLRGLDFNESLQFMKESKSGYCILTRARECGQTPRRLHSGDSAKQSFTKNDRDTIRANNDVNLSTENAGLYLETLGHVESSEENFVQKASKSNEDNTDEGSAADIDRKGDFNGKETVQHGKNSKEHDVNKSDIDKGDIDDEHGKGNTQDREKTQTHAEAIMGKEDNLHNMDKKQKDSKDAITDSTQDSKPQHHITTQKHKEDFSETDKGKHGKGSDTLSTNNDEESLSDSRTHVKSTQKDSLKKDANTYEHILGSRESISEKASDTTASEQTEHLQSIEKVEKDIKIYPVTTEKADVKDEDPSRKSSDEQAQSSEKGSSKNDKNTQENSDNNIENTSDDTVKNDESLSDDVRTEVNRTKANSKAAHGSNEIGLVEDQKDINTNQTPGTDNLRKDPAAISKQRHVAEEFDTNEDSTPKPNDKDSIIIAPPEAKDLKSVIPPEITESPEAIDYINEATLKTNDSKGETTLEATDSTSEATQKTAYSAIEPIPEVKVVSKDEAPSEGLDFKDERTLETINSKAEAPFKEAVEVVSGRVSEDSDANTAPSEGPETRSRTEVDANMVPNSEEIIAQGKTTSKKDVATNKTVAEDANNATTSEKLESQSEARPESADATSGRTSVGADERHDHRLSEWADSYTNSQQNLDSGFASEKPNSGHNNEQSDDSSHVTSGAESRQETNNNNNNLVNKWFLNIEQRYSDKIQSLELQISRMENHLLQESFDVQSKKSAIDHLEKHILRLESEILRFNHTFRDLQSEHKRLIQSQKTQIQQIGGSRELAEPSPSKKSTDGGSSCLMAVEEQQNKIKHLSEMVQKQSSLLEKLQEKFHQVEGDNHILVKQILNQSILMNEILSKMNAMNQEQEQHKSKLKTIQESCEKSSRWYQKATHDGNSQTQREDELEILMGRTRFSSAERYPIPEDDERRPRIPKEIDPKKIDYDKANPHENSFELKSSEPTLPPSLSLKNKETSSSQPTSMNIGHPEAFPSDENPAQTGEGSTDLRVKATTHGHFQTEDKEYRKQIQDEFNKLLERNSDDEIFENRENDDLRNREEDDDDLQSIKESPDDLSKAQNKENEIKDASDDSKESRLEDNHTNGEDPKVVDDDNALSEEENLDDLNKARDDENKSKETLDDGIEKDFGDGIKHNEILPVEEDAKPAEVKPAEEKPAEEKSAEVKPAEKTSVDVKPVEEKPAEASEDSQKSNKQTSGKLEKDKQIPTDKVPIKRLLKPSSKSPQSNPTKASNIEKPSEKPESPTTDNGTRKQAKPKANMTTTSPQSPPVAREVDHSAKVAANVKPKSKPQASMPDAFPDPPIYEMKERDNMKDCYDHYTKGRRHNTPLKVFPGKGNKAVEVYCDMKNGGWTLIQRRQDGSVDFYRNWNEYKTGFGSIYGEHWIGNEFIHQLTNQEHYSLRVELTDWDRNTHVVDYARFRISDESDGYRIFVTGYKDSPAGDSLTKHHGNRFSTVDVDNDLVEKEFDGGNCARRFSGAWWYFKCYKSNLNGKYYRGGSVDADRFDGVAWKSWTGSKYSLKKVEMKIIPRSLLKS